MACHCSRRGKKKERFHISVSEATEGFNALEAVADESGGEVGGGVDPTAASSSRRGDVPAAEQPLPKRVCVPKPPPAPPPASAVIFHTIGYSTLHLCTPQKISK